MPDDVPDLADGAASDPDEAAAATEPAPVPGQSGVVLDAGALKALAHPLRYRLLELLAETGPATASGLGRVVGESSGSTSYHLRQLAEHGLIEEATDVGNARDRWWRAPEGGWTLRGIEMLEREDTRLAASVLLNEVERSMFERVQRWHRDGPRWGAVWAEASIESSTRLRLTRDDLAALSRELVAVVDRYRDAEVPDDTPDSALAAIHVHAFPTEAPPTALPGTEDAAEGDPGTRGDAATGAQDDGDADTTR